MGLEHGARDCGLVDVKEAMVTSPARHSFGHMIENW